MRRHHILLPLAALLATLPLLLHGCSCGHDFGFHLQSWLDAAQQLRHGTLYPHWAWTAAYNAGEPRFIFYPPLSWMLGALLTILFPISATPAIYTWIAFTAAGFAMHHLARQYTSPNAALLAAALYMANPYMLFNAFERTAYAELLAAAWIPLLLLAVLRKRPTVQGIAIPVALLWLTNAPAAVMGCYMLALLAVVRLVAAFRASRPQLFPLLLTMSTGTVLGLALPAFYLVPAAYERRYVQIAMAIIPNMRFEDNFLFGHTADTPHNVVLHTISLLAVVLLLLTLGTVAFLLFQTQKDRSQQEPARPGTPAPYLALLTVVIAFLLVPISTPLWRYLPDLAFLQFPWRLLTILSAVLVFAIALLLPRGDSSRKPMLIAAPVCVLVLSLLGITLYRQACEATGLPSATAALFSTHHGVPPTDEYTPNEADNDILRSNDPGYWLTSNPAGFAPGTIPNPAATDPNFSGELPVEQTVSAQAPRHLVLNLAQPETLVLNLRDFPDWRLTRNGTELPAHLQRDDGLLAIALPSGLSTLDIAWRYTLDQKLGIAISACALVLLGLTFLRSRKIKD
ncbi:6-pyruvoyl-tetrahydropterin synthase-related protein [Granulicella mallensis]|uniref:Membrane protein, 6-pyruvoyl-tetrahydropterin synthase-related domain protein n=1 Tax=Granulicella mallensis (strain ATCC BAA-1857 / DSM 23137 / MP5ACTX8) TaxID=682795 RepID=G8P1C7_GRAMM|nr:6-pyruvoyl-tetrahydropterin synthase-related protein [Granulicella mallensis]AEU38145.1 Membrane protein, 6-pyruvoyl-tetrahydropterin synthase-related domain protein [Granulicella mallensis MP5ACTX8]